MNPLSLAMIECDAILLEILDCDANIIKTIMNYVDISRGL